MSIKLKHSGGNSVSLNPPTSAPTSSEVAFKLPNADGSANQALVSDGSGNLSFASVAGGKLLQVQYASTSGVTNLPETGTGSIVATASDSSVDITSLSITPASTNSKILVIAHIESEAYNSSGNGCYGGSYLYRGSSSSGTAIRSGSQGANTGSYFMIGLEYSVLDSPNTTSAQTYTMTCERWSSSTTKHTIYQWSLFLAEIGA